MPVPHIACQSAKQGVQGGLRALDDLDVSIPVRRQNAGQPRLKVVAVGFGKDGGQVQQGAGRSGCGAFIDETLKGQRHGGLRDNREHASHIFPKS